MKILENLYCDSKIQQKRDDVISKLEAGRPVYGVQVIVLALREDEQLEIFSSLYFLEPGFAEQDYVIAGLAADKKSATELVAKIVKDAYAATGRVDNLKSYLLETRN